MRSREPGALDTALRIQVRPSFMLSLETVESSRAVIASLVSLHMNLTTQPHLHFITSFPYEMPLASNAEGVYLSYQPMILLKTRPHPPPLPRHCLHLRLHPVQSPRCRPQPSKRLSRYGATPSSTTSSSSKLIPLRRYGLVPSG